MNDELDDVTIYKVNLQARLIAAIPLIEESEPEVLNVHTQDQFRQQRATLRFEEAHGVLLHQDVKRPEFVGDS